MSHNKKYYYIKLKDNYFEQDNIKVLEAVPNGHVYSLIIVKLYLKATKYGGQLKMTESIPYDPQKIDILANVLNHDVAHVKEAIKLSSELGIISIFDTGEIWMTEIQNFIGHSSSEADRKREYRSNIKLQKMDKMGHLSDVRPPEIEIEIEIEKDKKKDKKFNFKKSLLFLGVDESTAKDWLLVRKTKGATNTETAFQAIKSQIEKSSLSANDCIRLAVIRDWKGFSNSWIKEEYMTELKKEKQEESDIDNEKLAELYK